VRKMKREMNFQLNQKKKDLYELNNVNNSPSKRRIEYREGDESRDEFPVELKKDFNNAIKKLHDEIQVKKSTRKDDPKTGRRKRSNSEVFSNSDQILPGHVVVQEKLLDTLLNDVCAGLADRIAKIEDGLVVQGKNLQKYQEDFNHHEKQVKKVVYLLILLIVLLVILKL